MNVDTKRSEPKRVLATLIIPLAISASSWVFATALLHNASSYDLEGDYYLTAFVGVLSFVTAGPFAGVFLARFLREGTISTGVFGLLFFLVSLPTITFEVIAFSSSILPVFMPRHLWTNHNMGLWYVEASTVAVAFTAVYCLVMLVAARKGFAQSVLAAAVLALTTFGVVVFRVMHP